MDHHGLGCDVTLLDPRDHDGPGDRHIADRIRDDLCGGLQRGLLGPLIGHVRCEGPDRHSRADHDRATAEDGHTTTD